MPENENEGLSSNTNTSIPQEKWEQKMLANEKTALVPPAQAAQADKKEEKKDKKAIEDKNQIKEDLEKAQAEDKKE